MPLIKKRVLLEGFDTSVRVLVGGLAKCRPRGPIRRLSGSLYGLIAYNHEDSSTGGFGNMISHRKLEDPLPFGLVPLPFTGLRYP